MRNKTRVFGVITLYIVALLIYILIFLLGIKSIQLYIFLTISSVAVLSTSTIYTVIHSKEENFPPIRKKRTIPQKQYPTKRKALEVHANEFIEDYFEANPLVDSYVNSGESFEDFPRINEYIFSTFKKEEIERINLLELSKMDKIFFIRELIYFDPEERVQLIDAMIKNQELAQVSISYNPPKTTIVVDEKIRVYIRSLIEPGEKTKIMIIETNEFIKIIKQNISVLFDYVPEDFLISSGGILLDEELKITDYNIEDDDEIALIPTRKKINNDK